MAFFNSKRRLLASDIPFMTSLRRSPWPGASAPVVSLSRACSTESSSRWRSRTPFTISAAIRSCSAESPEGAPLGSRLAGKLPKLTRRLGGLGWYPAGALDVGSALPNWKAPATLLLRTISATF
eukprot:CAMPEP_0115068040 /NCGR_PEP_ID=MMETSP0227-20121206/11742_1 /TAXON_ID=89957 /ORGANISM="Polarella glacialis, Strain CCMP 1383" /LENGTH=123 /DNA_ID=CAMNT_0002454209 /DNA_START=93 /DNA_END=464 /DNA_ORIENTATION=-